MHTKTDLLKGNILKSLILFAIPLINFQFISAAL